MTGQGRIDETWEFRKCSFRIRLKVSREKDRRIVSGNEFHSRIGDKVGDMRGHDYYEGMREAKATI